MLAEFQFDCKCGSTSAQTDVRDPRNINFDDTQMDTLKSSDETEVQEENQVIQEDSGDEGEVEQVNKCAQ
jgi:hypothetical protein